MAVIMMTWLPAMVRPLDVHLSSSDSRGYAPYMENQGHRLDQSHTLFGSTRAYMPHSTTVRVAGGEGHPSPPPQGGFRSRPALSHDVACPAHRREPLDSNHSGLWDARASSFVS